MMLIVKLRSRSGPGLGPGLLQVRSSRFSSKTWSKAIFTKFGLPPTQPLTKLYQAPNHSKPVLYGMTCSIGISIEDNIKDNIKDNIQDHIQDGIQDDT